jgi:hypothetical protein
MTLGTRVFIGFPAGALQVYRIFTMVLVNKYSTILLPETKNDRPGVAARAMLLGDAAD